MQDVSVCSEAYRYYMYTIIRVTPGGMSTFVSMSLTMLREIVVEFCT